MANKIALRGDELLERRLDRIEINIGEKTVDGRVNAHRFAAEYVAVRGDEIGQNLQIRKPARISGRRIKAADALIMIALGVERARLEEPFLGEARMLPQQRIAESRPE